MFGMEIPETLKDLQSTPIESIGSESMSHGVTSAATCLKFIVFIQVLR